MQAPAPAGEPRLGETEVEAMARALAMTAQEFEEAAAKALAAKLEGQQQQEDGALAEARSLSRRTSGCARSVVAVPVRTGCTGVCVCVCVCVCVYTRTHAQSHAQKHIIIYVNVCASVYICMHTHKMW